MITKEIIYLILVVLFWSINPFFKKKLTNKLNSIELNLCYSILSIMFVVFITYANMTHIMTSSKSSVNLISIYTKLTHLELLFLLVSSIITFLASFFYLKALKSPSMSANFVNSFTNSLSIIASTVISLYLNNSLNSSKVFFKLLLGSFLTISGVYTLNLIK